MRNRPPQKTTNVLGLGKTKDDVEEEPTLMQGRRCQDTRRGKAHHQEMKQCSAEIGTQSKASKTGEDWVGVGKTGV